MKFGEIFVWTANVLKHFHPTNTPTQSPHHNLSSLASPSPLQILTLNPEGGHPKDFHDHFSHQLPPTLNTNNPAPTCIFTDPLPPDAGGAPLIHLSQKIWSFLAALLSHSIQNAHESGKPLMDTIDVEEMLLEYAEEGEVEGFGLSRVDGVFIGLVYSGRSEDVVGGNVRRCVEYAIRDVYETQQLSGWMSLGNGGVGDEDEWVSYVIYQEV